MPVPGTGPSGATSRSASPRSAAGRRREVAEAASRERPWPAWHVLLSHLRDRRNARTGADFKPSRGAQSGTRLSPSPGVRAPSSGAGRGLRVPACSACIHARRPRVWVSRKKPHLLPLPAQAVCGTVVWGRPAPAPLWGVVWLCVGEPYFTERRPTADACAPRSGFGWCLRRPAGHSPERQWPDHRACLLLIQRVWPAAREKPPCSRVSDAPMRQCDRRCETLRSRRSDRRLICILIASGGAAFHVLSKPTVISCPRPEQFRSLA